MSPEVVVAIVEGSTIDGFHRGADGAVDQVARFVTKRKVAPEDLAAIVADLGDRFGWSDAGGVDSIPAPGEAPRPIAAPSPGALPPTNGHRHPTPRKYAPVVEDVERIIDYVRRHPGCTRRDLCALLYPGEEYTRSGSPIAGRTAQRVVIRTRAALETGRITVEVHSGATPDRLYAVEEESP